MNVDPLHQFMLKVIYPIKIFGIDISFTNSSLFMLLAVSFIIVFIKWGMHGKSLIPNRIQSMVELSYEFTAGLVKENAGKEGLQYVPFVFSVFMFVLISNLLGMLPYGFTVTSHIIVTFALAMIIFAFTTILSIYKLGFGFFKKFLPDGVPLAIAPIIIPVEVISYIFRPISLSVRLFANMLAGHIMLKIFASFIIPIYIISQGTVGYFQEEVGMIAGALAGILPFSLNVIFTGFEFFVAIVQAYIFTVISCIYINDAMHAH